MGGLLTRPRFVEPERNFTLEQHQHHAREWPHTDYIVRFDITINDIQPDRCHFHQATLHHLVLEQMEFIFAQTSQCSRRSPTYTLDCSPCTPSTTVPLNAAKTAIMRGSRTSTGDRA